MTADILNRLYVVLVATRNPLNIGAAARAMSNFGVMHLRVVNPFDPSFREAQSAVGAEELLRNAEQFGSVAEAVADCSLVVGTTAARDRELQHPMHALTQAAPLIREHSGKVAVLFGSEKRGLSNEDLSHCHWLMHIPTRTEHLSMNLGQAVAVCMYEIARTSSTIADMEQRRATAGDLEGLTQTLLETLTASEYLKGSAVDASEEKLRRLVRRLNLDEADAETLLAMLRKINRKLKRET
ncbi:RNA methyltransferase TrmH, group 1 [Candidatus Koribacter versatilis Ellin345]|uniref:tRNA (cytidine/uridine-2'-O-)-methyltransferase TrmJ n=1 Tax=Koribacter versatilis (strain Ellin345) TaxID=204669 RepID=Q1IPT2_KORVE|nr:RNA methyltransferase [Candidatus Koribacter versatilis]ABF41118.1 RNA methyltransferase TrmH, group 1 [Candidatus Koribacter versatilis Ellin345]